jgi:hypothetical protein
MGEEVEEKEKVLKLLTKNLAEYAGKTFWIISNLEGRSGGLLDYC